MCPTSSSRTARSSATTPTSWRIIGPKLGVKVQFIDTAWSGIIPALYAGKFDCIVSAMTITAPRAEKVLFSMPYADASNVILLRADEDPHQDRRRPVGQDHRRAAWQRRRRHHQDLRGEAEGGGQARLRQREGIRALSGSLSGPDQQAGRCGGELEVHDDGGDARRARQVQDDRRRVRHHRVFRHGVPQGRRRAAGFREHPACAR